MKRFVIVTVLALFLFSFKGSHPFYLGVTEMKYSAKEKSFETTIKLFTNDLEDALKKIYKTKIDLINGKDKTSINTILTDYIKNHYKVSNGIKPEKAFFDFVGYEQESEAVWIYLQFSAPETVQKMEIENTLLYDYLPSQTNIVHIDVNGVRKSSKVSNPEKKLVFEF